MRERIGKIAIDAAAAVDYRSAGTVEGLQVGEDYFFLEMNTRVQVEHCVTEMVDRDRHRPRAGPDRRRRAALDRPGRGRAARPRDRVPDQRRGRAQELRARAGQDHLLPRAGGPGVRVDSGVDAGSEVTPMYDPMVAKLIVWDVDREHATARMLRALDEYEVGGLTTLIPFHRALLATEQWQRAETCRDLIADRDWLKALAPEEPPTPRARTTDGGERSERAYQVEVDGRLFGVKVIGDAAPAAADGGRAGLRRPPRRERAAGGGGGGGATEELASPIQGTVLKVAVEKGAEVEEGALICVVEAMKMENEITAHRSGKLSALNVTEGGSVTTRRRDRRDRVRRGRRLRDDRRAAVARARRGPAGPPASTGQDAQPPRRADAQALALRRRLRRASSCSARRGCRSGRSARPSGRLRPRGRRDARAHAQRLPGGAR